MILNVFKVLIYAYNFFMCYYIFDLRLLSFDLWSLFAILKKICFDFKILCNTFLLAFLNFGFMLIIFLSMAAIHLTGK